MLIRTQWMELMGKAINLATADFFPFLRTYYRSAPLWMNPTRKWLIRLRTFEDGLFLSLLESAKDKIAAGKVYPSESSMKHKVSRYTH